MSIHDPLEDNKSNIQLIDQMGSDLSIVNDARSTFEVESRELTEKDVKLLKYLIKHQHTSPFRGVVFKFRVKAPLFVCRQWWKHIVASNHNDEQLSWNEKSLRYTSIKDHNEFYIPKQFRKQAKVNKQATEGILEPALNNKAVEIYEKECRSSYETYSTLLELGVGREQARGVLVPSVYTSWVWTTSVQALIYFMKLRQGNEAQYEIQAYANSIFELVYPFIPVTIDNWMSS